MAERMPLLRLQAPLLPSTDLGLHITDAQERNLVSSALESDKRFGVVLQTHSGDRTYEIGTVANIGGYARLPDGRFLLEVEGGDRIKIDQIKRSQRGRGFEVATVQVLHDSIGNLGRARAASLEVSRLFHLYRARRGDADLPVALPVDPIARSYIIASNMKIDAATTQKLLELDTAEDRLAFEHELLTRELTVLDHLLSTRG